MNISLFEKIFKNREIQPSNHYQFFSVLVPLVNQNGKIHVLFEVRSSNLIRQPNEICFPGGRIEKNESPKACAIRETYEELNIPSDRIKIISELDYIINYNNFTLYSFLGEVDIQDIKMKMNKNEVQDIFMVPFDFFMETKPLLHEVEIIPKLQDDFPFHLIENGKAYNWRTVKAPIYFYQFKDKVIWGLTARIIANMVEIIKEEHKTY